MTKDLEKRKEDMLHAPQISKESMVRSKATRYQRSLLATRVLVHHSQPPDGK